MEFLFKVTEDINASNERKNKTMEKIFSSKKPIITYIIIGFFAQLIDGSLGMAYGVSCRTFLNIFGKVPSNIISAIIHYAEIPTSFVSMISHIKFKNINKTLFCNLVIPGILGGIIGSYVITLNLGWIELGIDIYDIYNKVLCKKTMPQYNLMKIGMDRLEFLENGKIAFTYILEDDFSNVGAIPGEHEGIVDIGRNIDGVEVSIFIRENDGWTISLRSTGGVDVSRIALNIGGGGHKMASGAKLQGTFNEVKSKIIDETKKVMFE